MVILSGLLWYLLIINLKTFGAMLLDKAAANAQVEFWLNSRRCGIRAIMDTKGMDEDQKLKAITKASMALKDFNDRLLAT